MNNRLGDIANLHFGPYVKDKTNTGVKYLSAGHFDEFGLLTKFIENPSYISVDIVENELLAEGDVILTGKGLRFFAWSYKREFGNCVASSLFYIIKVDITVLLPDYLTLLLNTSKIKHQLGLISGGASVPSIPKKELIELTLEFPTLLEQQKIIDIAKVLDKNIALTAQLLEQKQDLKKGILNKLIYG